VVYAASFSEHRLPALLVRLHPRKSQLPAACLGEGAYPAKVGRSIVKVMCGTDARLGAHGLGIGGLHGGMLHALLRQRFRVPMIATS
jgi:hypothetical protein